ncbi:MAG TPA: MFS transporter [Bryobacteraceae bacterium]|nr:MFS transporter [Bryobacteraceae bacterium]
MPFLFLLYVVAYIDRINISFAGLQMTGELGFSDAVFGFGSGVFFFGYTLLAIPGAVLVEKWSARKAMALTMLVWGFVASGTGLIHTKSEFYSMRFLLGVTEAGFFPGVITYLSRWYRTEDRAKAVALFMAAIPVSKVIAAPISAGLLKADWLGLSGWRWLLILEGAPAVVCGILSLLCLTDWPSQARWLNPRQREWLIGELERERTGKQNGERMPLLQALRHRDVLLLCAAYFGGTTGDYGLGIWLPKMLQKLGNLSVVNTSLLTAIPALVSIPAMLLCGSHSDRVGERRWHTAIPRIVAGLALASATIYSMGVPAALAVFTIASAGIMAAYPSLWAIPSSFLGSTAAAASIGLINAFGNLGGFTGPYLIGWFSTQTGEFTGGLWSIAAALVLSGVFVLLVRARTHPKT